MTTDGLLRLVIEYQRKQGWNESEFCAFLGIRPDVWAHYKAGERPLGQTFRRTVWEKIPGLRDYIFIK